MTQIGISWFENVPSGNPDLHIEAVIQGCGHKVL
jgi:hypothetical protein